MRKRKNEDDAPITSNEQLVHMVEDLMHEKFKEAPATRKQKWKLKSLGVKFDKNISKSQAFFIIRERVDGIKCKYSELPNKSEN